MDTTTHDIYLANSFAIKRYSSDGALLEEFGNDLPIGYRKDIAVDPTSGDVYVSTQSKTYYYPGLNFPLPTTGAASNPTNTTVSVNGTVRPDGEALTDCRFQYVTEAAFQASGFADLSSGGSEACAPGFASIPTSGQTAVSATLSGLTAGTSYRFRLLAANANGPNYGQSTSFGLGEPGVETTGSPVRTATTARLDARLYAHGLPTTYHFEYGSQGPCSVPDNGCQSTESRPAGAGATVGLVSQEVEGLEPDTTYHYRVVADNGGSSGAVFGADMTVATRASDAPLSHGRFPGPPGSDRAYEQVSLPDTGGNPVHHALAVSDDGNRAFYKVLGGTPISNTGTISNMLFAERTASGWRSEDAGPPRGELVGGSWVEPAGRTDLSDQIATNINTTTSDRALWRVRPGQPPVKVFADGPFHVGTAIISADGSRVLVTMAGSQDPAYPTPPAFLNLYDVSSGTPHLVSLLPGDSVSACIILAGGSAEFARRAMRWVSPDGSLAFFETCGDLYMRDLEAEETKLIGAGSFIKWTPGGVFFVSGQSFAPDDTGGQDIYRYDLGDESLECVTCVVAGFNANVGTERAIAPDGSRVYFASASALLPGAASPGIYRVNVASGELAYVAPGGVVGEDPTFGGALTPDGSTLTFASSNAGLNALGGQQNGDRQQFYRYNDRDRSLTCLSCPQDGGVPQRAVEPSLANFSQDVGANRTALSADGRIFAFATNNALLAADQNTARAGQDAKVGGDIYEWRDGRLLMVTDGISERTGERPEVNAITPSGNDIFFTAATQYTQDALDGFSRLYNARIGGGFPVPPPPKPCPLEVCQGTPKGAPEEQAPGTGTFAGPGNATSSPGRRPCPKGRHKARKGGKSRCVKSQSKKQQKQRQRAKHDRRTAR